MNSKLYKIFLGILVAYGIILVSLFYWQTCADLTKHSANPRYYQVFKDPRGTIYDRQGQILAESIATGDGQYQREYASKSLSHIVGYFHHRFGMTGLESIYHKELLKGRQIHTTIDLEIQQVAEEALANYEGAVIVLNPANGEILAMVSMPAVNGNELDQNWPDYLNDLRSPFLNRATDGLYPPGSTIKPIVYGAALVEEIIDPSTIWNDAGVLYLKDRSISNSGKRVLGQIRTDEALAYSSNVVFAQLATDLGNVLLDYYRSFGLGTKVDFILGNQNGFVPSNIPSLYDAALLGIGQGELLVTPLQMAVVVATIANRGLMMRPYLVKEQRGGLQLRTITRPQEVRQVLPEQVVLNLRDAMELAVEEGTANVGYERLHMAAKTGTAQTNQGGDHAWFIGFAPSRLPQVAVAVVIEHGGAGGKVAAPIGAEIISKALEVGRERER